MRTPLSGELTTLALPHVNPYIKVEIMDTDSNWRDLSSVTGEDWMVGCRWTDSGDSPGITGTITIWRENKGTSKSMSPLMTGSTVNRNVASAYAPFLDTGRLIRISTAVVAAGGVVSSWREALQGVTGMLTMRGKDDTEISVDFRDLMGILIDAQIEVVRAYGAPTGVAVETVMQQILNDNGYSSVSVVTPASPGWMLQQYAQDKQGVYEAIHELAQQIGYDFRYKYNSSNVYGATFYAPNRIKTVSDATIGPSQYDDVQEFVIDGSDIRNVVDVVYTDYATGVRSLQTASDSTSITKYRRKYMAITEDTASNIDTAAEALALANAAIADLSQPGAQETIKMIFWPLVEIGDLYTFSANGVHYDTDQQRSVISYTHEFTGDGDARTTIVTRGKPSSQFMNWLNMQGSTQDLPDLSVSTVVTQGAITISFSGSNVTLQIDGGAVLNAGTSPLVVVRDVVDHMYLFTATNSGGQLVYPVNIPAVFKVGPELSYSVDSSGVVTVHVIGRSGAVSSKVFVKAVGIATLNPTPTEIAASGTTVPTQTGPATGIFTAVPFTKFLIGAYSVSSQGVLSDPAYLEGSWLGASATPAPAMSFGTPAASANLLTVPITLGPQAQRVEFFHVESVTDLSGGTGVAINVEGIAADVYDWVERAKDGTYQSVMRFPIFRANDYVNLTAIVTDVLGMRGDPVNLMVRAPSTPATLPDTPTAPSSVTTTATTITANCLIPNTGVTAAILRRYVDGNPLADISITASRGSTQSVSFGTAFIAATGHTLAWSTVTSTGAESLLSPATSATTTSGTTLSPVTSPYYGYDLAAQQVMLYCTAPAGTPSGTTYEVYRNPTGASSGLTGYYDTGTTGSGSLGSGAPINVFERQIGGTHTVWFKIVTRCPGWADSAPSAVIAASIPAYSPVQAQ